MMENGRPEVSLFDVERIGAALRLAGEEALREHALAGYSVPVWRDGKVVWITPAEILERVGPTPNGSGRGA